MNNRSSSSRRFWLAALLNEHSTATRRRGAGFAALLTVAVVIVALVVTFVGDAQAAQAAFSTTAPTLGTNDISQLTGHVTLADDPGYTQAKMERSNVGGTGNSADQDTYIANNQMIQGQTFRTGSNTNGYQLTAVTLKEVTYTTFAKIPDINYTIRITNPATNTLTVLAQETALATADAPDNFPNTGDSGAAGSGNFVTFTFDSPVILNPNTTYGFDVGGGSVEHYWETDGRYCTPATSGNPSVCDPIDVYTNGTAYSSGSGGTGNTSKTNRTGDRVFVVALTPANVIIPPNITIQPRSVALYAGRTAQISAKASGSPTLAYQWKKSGTNISNGGNISGALTDLLTISNVTVADAGSYSMMVTNAAGPTNSLPATLTVVAAPAPGANYAYAIFTNNPLAYWRLNETGDPSTNPPAYDYIGGRIGTYESASLNGVAGPRPSAFPGFESTNTAAQSAADTDLAWVTVPALNLNTNTVTFTAWIYPIGEQLNDAGVFWTRSGTTAGFGYGGAFAGNAGQLSYTWNGLHYDFVSGLVIPSDQWSFVAVVIEPTKASLYLGTGGSLSNSINSAVILSSEGWSGIARIGSDPQNNGFTRNYNGIVDELAVFKRSFSFDEVNTLYGIGRGVVQPVPPTIGTQPRPQALYASRTARFISSASGSSPLVYRWRKNGTNINDGGNISGALTDSLTVANVSATDAANYTLVVTNMTTPPANSVTSAPAALTIAIPTGKAYESAVRTANPIAYWRLNETGDPSSGTLSAFNFMGGLNGTYGPVSQPGVAGLLPPDFAELELTNKAVQTTANGDTASWVTLPAINLNTNTATFTAWIYPNATHDNYNGLLTTRNGSTVNGAGLHFTLDNQLGYTWNNGHAETYTFASELRPPEFEWSFVALVIDPNNATLYLYNTNALSSTNNAISHTSEAWDGNAQLGGDQETPNNRIFDGTIDEVAVFNYALTPPQILNLYNSAFTAAPPSVTLTIQKAGSNVVLIWPQGTLQSAPNVTGTYTNVPSATSPYTNSPTGSQKFYRVQVQ